MTMYYIGNSYYSLNNSDSALVYLQKSIQVDSSNINAGIYLADVLASKDLKAESKERFRQTIEIGLQDTAKYSRELNVCFAKFCGLLLEEKSYKDLQNNSKLWSDYFPKQSLSWLYLAISYQAQSDKDNACRYYKKVLQLDPKNAPAKKNYELLQCDQ